MGGGTQQQNTFDMYKTFLDSLATFSGDCISFTDYSYKNCMKLMESSSWNQI